MGFRQFSCIVRGDARRDCLIHRIAILGISWLRHRSLISSAKTLQNSFKNEEIRRKVRKMDTNPKVYKDRNPRGKMRPGNITVQSWSAAAFVRPLSPPLPGVVCATKATLLLREGRALHGWRLRSQMWTPWLKSSLRNLSTYRNFWLIEHHLVSSISKCPKYLCNNLGLRSISKLTVFS